MDPTLKVALIAGASAIIGGLITGVVLPHVTWSIEKKKQKLAYQREQIKRWRAMIAEVAKQRGSSGTLAELLERREEFHSLKRHVDHIVIAEIYNPHTTVVGSTIDAGLSYLADEITKLEKQWKLL